MKHFLSLLAISSSGLAAASAQIFADFTTSKGNFTCELNYLAAPRTVANFIGLADGSRPWVDVTTGEVVLDKPYYDGSPIHRVVKDFMNQFGSRNGQGTDGPGYVFMDEFDDNLKHSGAGVLSMANSGPNSNGAQFFITTGAASHLDGVHSVFGSVSSGMSVVYEINQVETIVGGSGQNDKPAEAIFLESVRIRRVGEAANAFDIHAHGLPTCGNAPGHLEVVPNVSAKFHLKEPLPQGTRLLATHSTNLRTWTKIAEIYNGVGGPGGTLIPLDAANDPAAFYNLALVQYPDARFPSRCDNKTLQIDWTTSSGQAQSIRGEFDAEGTGGTLYYSQNPQPQPILSCQYYPDPYTATWIIETPELAPLGIVVTSTGTANGTFELYTYGFFGWSFFSEGPFVLTE
jgi:peptidyl-prolyl cis-trans isomerase A (cyclophilin A)